MRHNLVFTALFSLAVSTLLSAQGPGRTGKTTVVANSGPTAAQRAALSLTDTDLYCSGYFAQDSIHSGITVLGGPDGGLKNEFSDGDAIYLTKGNREISTPESEYMILRAEADPNMTESFPGQHDVLKQMGTLYAEIARIRVRVVNEKSATAEILHACQPVLAGDIAVPFSARSAPPLRNAAMGDRYAPASGKPTGVIAAIKEFQQAAGTDHPIYLNIGKKKGANVGAYVRIYRKYGSASDEWIQKSTENYPIDIMGTYAGHKLSPEEKAALPRTILGEAIILSANDDTATALITYSWEDIYPGDEVEIE